MDKKYKPKIDTGNMIGRSHFNAPLSRELNIQGYGLKNFKSWKNSGFIDFKRVNLVFGQNSAGKSALLQSILSSADNQNSLQYVKHPGVPEFLELLTKTIDLGDFSQVHRTNSSNSGIFISYSNNHSNIEMQAEYKEDPVSKKPKLKSYELVFKSSPFLVHTQIQRKNSSSRNRYATSRKGVERLIYLNGTIKIKPKKLSSELKKELADFHISESIFSVDCSKLSFKEKEGEHTGFLVPKLDNILLSHPGVFRPGMFRSRRGQSFLTGTLNNQRYTSETYFFPGSDKKEIRVDSNLEFLGRIIEAAEWVFMGRVVHIPPIRGIPSRISTTQDMSSDPSVAYVYEKYSNLNESQRQRGFISRRRPSQSDKYNLKRLVDEDLKELGLPYTVEVRSDSFNGAPLTNIMILDQNKKELSLLDVGRGISQLLPIIVSAHSERGVTILVEQPEVHIHPKLQADLADIFINSVQNQWIIETHSENVLFRIQKRIREGLLDPSEVQCIYVDTKDGSALPLSIGFNRDGSLNKEFPPGFFDIGLEELIP